MSLWWVVRILLGIRRLGWIVRILLRLRRIVWIMCRLWWIVRIMLRLCWIMRIMCRLWIVRIMWGLRWIVRVMTRLGVGWVIHRCLFWVRLVMSWLGLMRNLLWLRRIRVRIVGLLFRIRLVHRLLMFRLWGGLRIRLGGMLGAWVGVRLRLGVWDWFRNILRMMFWNRTRIHRRSVRWWGWRVIRWRLWIIRRWGWRVIRWRLRSMRRWRRWTIRIGIPRHDLVEPSVLLEFIHGYSVLHTKHCLCISQSKG